MCHESGENNCDDDLRGRRVILVNVVVVVVVAFSGGGTLFSVSKCRRTAEQTDR